MDHFFPLVPITVQVVSENQVNLLNISFDENVSGSSNDSLHKNLRMSLLKKWIVVSYSKIRVPQKKKSSF